MTIWHRIQVAHILAHEAPDPDSEAVSDFLFGETVGELERQSGFVRVRNDYDHYEGWVPEAALGAGEAGRKPTHRVLTRLTPAYDAPEGRPVLEGIGIGSPIYPVATEGAWVQDESGLWIAAADLAEVPYALDAVELALGFIGVPYVWGGRHGGGIDCSGLVQICAMMKGLPCVRDTKDQVLCFGEKLGGLDAPGRRRGDLLYMPGHVAILTGPYEAVHADGKAGFVHVQDLESIVENRGFSAEDVTIRRAGLYSPR